jgi:hypothetical protein
MIHCGRGEAERDAGKPHCPVGGGRFVSSHWRFDASTRESFLASLMYCLCCVPPVSAICLVFDALESCPDGRLVLDGDRPDVRLTCSASMLVAFHVGCAVVVECIEQEVV